MAWAPTYPANVLWRPMPWPSLAVHLIAEATCSQVDELGWSGATIRCYTCQQGGRDGHRGRSKILWLSNTIVHDGKNAQGGSRCKSPCAARIRAWPFAKKSG